MFTRNNTWTGRSQECGRADAAAVETTGVGVLGATARGVWGWQGISPLTKGHINRDEGYLVRGEEQEEVEEEREVSVVGEKMDNLALKY